MELDGAHILVVDDNPELLFTIQSLLEEAGAEVTTATNGEEALENAKKRAPQLLIMDVVMPKLGGLDTTKAFKSDEELRNIPIILLSSKDELEDISLGASAGAEDYMRKPFDSKELILRASSALNLGALYQQVNLLRNNDHGEEDSPIIGKSAAIQEALDTVIKIQDSEAPILVRGESGVGKELFAHAIHLNGTRKDSPFVVQNCSAIHENLLESELFGHVKGAFTGAVKDKVGLFETANTGTLFLDELGEMSLELQAKLLRVLEYGTFSPVGSTEEKSVDVRIVGATHRPIEEMVKNGEFREDLYYRLNVLSVNVPPLRERREDIPLLVNHFLQMSCRAQKKTIKQFSEEAMMFLERYDWPGNIRELQNEIERVVTMSGQATILGAGHLSTHLLSLGSNNRDAESETPLNELPQALYELPLKESLAIVEEEMLRSALHKYKGNKSEVARQLGISRSNLITKVQAYGLEEGKGERGASKLTILIFSTLVAIVGYLGYEIAPFFYYYHELQNQMIAMAKKGEFLDNKEIMKRLKKHMKKMQIPADPEDIEIIRGDRKMEISLHYSEVLIIPWFEGEEKELHTFDFHAYANERFQGGRSKF